MTLDVNNTKVTDVSDMIQFTGPSVVNHTVDVGRTTSTNYTYVIKNITTNGILHVSAVVSPFITLNILEFSLQPQQSKTIIATFNEEAVLAALNLNKTQLSEHITWTIVPVATT